MTRGRTFGESLAGMTDRLSFPTETPEPDVMYWVETRDEAAMTEYEEGMERAEAEAAGISLDELGRQMAEYDEAMEREEREADAAGGLRICPKCGLRKVRVRTIPTRQYGGGFDTTEQCENPACDYAEVFV